jgi:hypothetical protein
VQEVARGPDGGKQGSGGDEQAVDDDGQPEEAGRRAGGDGQHLPVVSLADVDEEQSDEYRL